MKIFGFKKKEEKLKFYFCGLKFSCHIGLGKKPAAKDVVCNICHSKSRFLFSGQIMNKYQINYYQCDDCRHLQTERPFWLKEAYKKAIAFEDTGILLRNIGNSKITALVINRFFDTQASFVEYAGGYGILTRLMRDNGYDFYWYDKYASNIFANGFEYDGKQKIELLTAFEILEHLDNPLRDIGKMFEISDSILISESLLPEPAPTQKDWWYYSPASGQHISFYTVRTFEKIAKHFGKNYVHFGDYHLLTPKSITEEDFIDCLNNFEEKFASQAHQMPSKTIDDMEYCISISSHKK